MGEMTLRNLTTRELLAIERTLLVAALSPCAGPLAHTLSSALCAPLRDGVGDSLRFEGFLGYCVDDGLLADGVGVSESGDDVYIVVRGTETKLTSVEVWSMGLSDAAFPPPHTIRHCGYEVLGPV
jgi:hypothetical protein